MFIHQRLKKNFIVLDIYTNQKTTCMFFPLYVHPFEDKGATAAHPYGLMTLTQDFVIKRNINSKKN